MYTNDQKHNHVISKSHFETKNGTKFQPFARKAKPTIYIDQKCANNRVKSKEIGK